MSDEEAVPEDVWISIFGKVDSVRDMGRLARVNRLFNRLITNATTQVRTIQIGQSWISLKTQLALFIHEEEEVEPGEDSFAELRADAPARALSFVEKVAREADNLEGLVLHLDWSHCVDQEHCALVSQCLRLLAERDKPKLKAFRLFYHASFLPLNNIVFTASADFIVSKAATLKNLSVKITAKEGPLPPPFMQAFQSCKQLETVKLVFHHMGDYHVAAVLGSILAGVHGLKSLQLRLFPNRRSPIINIFRRNDLRSLRHLDCHFETMENYVSTCQAAKPMGQRFLMGDHPLQNIQELTLCYCPLGTCGNPSFLSSFPQEDFGQLRLLRLNSLDAMELPQMVANFLSVFRQKPGPEKALELQVKRLRVDVNNWPCAPPKDVRSLAVAVQEAAGYFYPTFHSDPQRPNKNIIFQSGNAAFPIKIDSYSYRF